MTNKSKNASRNIPVNDVQPSNVTSGGVQGELKHNSVNPELLVLCVICVAFLLCSIGVVRTKISCHFPSAGFSLENTIVNIVPFLPIVCDDSLR